VEKNSAEKRMRILAWLFLIVSISLGAVIAPAVNADNNANALSVQFSLASPATVTQGEPIVLQYQIANSENAAITGFPKKEDQDWLSISLTDASGNAVPSRTQFSPEQYATGVGISLHHIPIPAAGTYENYEVINQRFAVPHPGKYILTVHMRLWYAYADPSMDDASELITQTFSRPITITTMDRNRLTTVAQSLTDAVLKAYTAPQATYEEQLMLVRALFSLPDTLAAPYWEKVGESHVEVAHFEVPHELYQVHTVVAAQVLAAIITHEASRNRAGMHRNWLDRMYDTSSDAQKQAIREVYSEYNIPASQFEDSNPDSESP
jgi:hypothetical protein